MINAFYPGYWFTGNGAGRDQDGYIQSKGCLDGTTDGSLDFSFFLGVAVYPGETAVVDKNDELTKQAVGCSRVCHSIEPEFQYDQNEESAFPKSLLLRSNQYIRLSEDTIVND